MVMTFNEYDGMVEKFENMQTPVYIPTFEQVEEIFKKEPEKWIKYACYILEKFPEKVTNSDKYVKSNIQNFVNEHLELVD